MSTLVRTGAVGAIALVVGYAALTTLRQGHTGGIPAPPHVAATRPDGRINVALQLCWSPVETGGVVRSVLGPGSGKADVQVHLDCAHPFLRTGTVARGDTIFIQWIMNPDGHPQSATYRVTVGNREARFRTVHSGMDYFECIAGASPCD